MLLNNKTIIVTGGSRGIGRAIVEEFSKEGANVAFNYLKSDSDAINLKEQIESSGSKCLIFKNDVRDYIAMKTMVEDVKAKFGRLDVIVNNAGIIKDKAFMLMEESEWGEVLSTNLSGVFNLTRASIVTFMKQKSGNIINIASVAGVIGLPRQVNYSASKAGVIGFTKALAKEVGSYNVRVNAIAPGYTDTDMVKVIKEDMREGILKNIPLGRFGKANEVAGTAVFLACEKSKYITGQIISIDGGLVM